MVKLTAATRRLVWQVGVVGLVGVGIALYAFNQNKSPQPAGDGAGAGPAQPGPDPALAGAVLPKTAAADPAAREKANALAQQGITLAKQGKINQAVGLFRESLALDPHCGSAHGNLGAALAHLKQPAQAVPHLEAAAELCPDDPSVHFNLAMILFRQRDAAGAARHFRETIRIKPDDVEARNNLAVILDQQGKAAEAIEQFREVLRLDPKRLPVVRQLAWHLATHPDENLRKADEAVEWAERLDQATGQRDPVVQDTLAAAYANAGRFAEAEQLAGKALEAAGILRQTQLAHEIQARLQLYREHQPYREEVNERR